MAAKKEQMAVSDFNLQKLSTQALTQHIMASIHAGSNIAVFGQRGSGKTEIAKKAIRDSGAKEVYLNLSVLERVDLGGYPNVMGGAKDRKFVDFLLPSFYEAMVSGDQPVVALLDEVDKADPSLWAPLLEFTQFKSINGMKLKNLKSVIMTGNLISEGGSRPSLPLLDRAEKFLVNSDAKQWIEWAGKHGKIHPAVVSFIYDHPQELHGSVDPDDRYADPSPRGWTGSSELINVGEKAGWSTELINQKVAGRVGKSAGIKFSNYLEYYQQLSPMIQDVFDGKDVFSTYKGLDLTKKLVSCMIVGARISAILTEIPESKKDKLPKSLGYVAKFLMKVDPEFAFITVRGQIGIDLVTKFELTDHPDFDPLFSKLQTLLNPDNDSTS